MHPAFRARPALPHLVALLLPCALLGVIACQSGAPPVDLAPATPKSPLVSSTTATPPIALASAPAASAASAAPPSPPPAPRSLWSVKTAGQTASLVDVIDGRVYALAGEYLEFGSPTRHVMSLDATTGKVLWSKDMGKALFAQSFVAGGLVVLTNTEGKKTVLDATTGAPSKKSASEQLVASQFTIDCIRNGNNFACGERATDTATGTDGKPAAPSATAGTPSREIDCVQNADNYLCGERATGTQLFQIRTSDPIGAVYQPPGLICVTHKRALTIECHDAKTGKALFRHAVPRLPVKEPDEVRFTFRIVERHLFVANYDGTIAAFEFDR